MNITIYNVTQKLLIGSLFILLPLAIACQGPTEATERPSIHVGLIAPINPDSTGPTGFSALNSARLAVSEINEAGGLLVGGQAHQIVLVEGDDGGTAETAAQTAQRLINQENVVALIGPPFSGTALAVAPLANVAKIPLITPTATNPEITPGRPYVFRATFDDNFQAVALASFIHSDLAYDRVAVLYDISNDYSRGLAETFRDSFSQLGGDVVAMETYTADTNESFSEQMQRIAASQPQAIFLPNFTSDVIRQRNEIREIGLEATLIGSDSWQGQRLSDDGGFVGSFFSGNYCRDMSNDSIRGFVEKYEAAFDAVPDGMAALTYDAFGLLFAAIQAEDSFEADIIQQGLYNVRYEGVTGPIIFDEDGNPDNKNVAIWIIDETERRCHAVIAPNR
jgi:branched-chain amino acid transport system substrate-binding protein